MQPRQLHNAYTGATGFGAKTLDPQARDVAAAALLGGTRLVVRHYGGRHPAITPIFRFVDGVSTWVEPSIGLRRGPLGKKGGALTLLAPLFARGCLAQICGAAS